MNTAVMPTAAKSKCVVSPKTTPESDMSPAVRPWQIERDIRSIMFGPGETAITIAAATKTAKCWRVNMVDLSNLMVGHFSDSRVRCAHGLD